MLANKITAVFCTAVLLLLGCQKNLTNLFADDQSEGLYIFSNTGNNILSCYVNGTPWRTKDRITYSGFPNPSRTDYELDIRKHSSGGNNDTLVFRWEGKFNDTDTTTFIVLGLSVKKGFTKDDFNALQEQRLVIDTSTNGYFTTNINGTIPGVKGNGSIYFNKSNIDSVGNLSGLFETTINGFKFTRGRFDEQLNLQMCRFD
jgi:hypothetical protein